MILSIAVSVFPHAYWGPGPFSFAAFVASLLLVQSWVGFPISWNYAAWSLSAEWLAYLAFMFLIKRVMSISRWPALLIIAFLCEISLVLILLMANSVTLNHAERLGLLRCGCEFFSGVMLCRVCYMKRFSVEIADCIFTLGACVVMIGVLFRSMELLSVFGFSAIILACGASSRVSGIFFANRLSVWLGQVSYSSYLTHALLLNAGLALIRTQGAIRWGVPLQLLIMVAALACVLPVSWLTWRFIETPGQKIGKRLAQRAFYVSRKNYGYLTQRNL
jgi:peptidoglycan/LPS O-acetylase OafA/YrhL